MSSCQGNSHLHKILTTPKYFAGLMVGLNLGLSILCCYQIPAISIISFAGLFSLFGIYLCQNNVCGSSTDCGDKKYEKCAFANEFLPCLVASLHFILNKTANLLSDVISFKRKHLTFAVNACYLFRFSYLSFA